jgi:hypothetical protein
MDSDVKDGARVEAPAATAVGASAFLTTDEFLAWLDRMIAEERIG